MNANPYVATSTVTMGFQGSLLTRNAISNDARQPKANTTEPMERAAAQPWNPMVVQP